MAYKPTNMPCDYLVAAYRTHGSVRATAVAEHVGKARVLDALSAAGITLPSRSEQLKTVWRTIRKGEIGRRTGPESISPTIIYRWKYNARSRDVPWLLTNADLQALWESQQGKCFFTGLPLLSPRATRDVYEQTNIPRLISIDRLDVSLPYQVGNVALVCVWVNLAKWKYGAAEFAAELEAAADSIIARRRGVQ